MAGRLGKELMVFMIPITFCYIGTPYVGTLIKEWTIVSLAQQPCPGVPGPGSRHSWSPLFVKSDEPASTTSTIKLSSPNPKLQLTPLIIYLAQAVSFTFHLTISSHPTPFPTTQFSACLLEQF
jgi:hypothetical protein